ncbi:hypothetical protein BdWA1_003138 [Babesia duncani]|uniref:Uncharacterized protein n=1 Tax=Babesia duncani TaxID=323732 RepID=A0AAD9UN73_9APIC|nr:hypothetical protein BdWA1_003138 [Babesia duncani]
MRPMAQHTRVVPPPPPPRSHQPSIPIAQATKPIPDSGGNFYNETLDPFRIFKLFGLAIVSVYYLVVIIPSGIKNGTNFVSYGILSIENRLVDCISRGMVFFLETGFLRAILNGIQGGIGKILAFLSAKFPSSAFISRCIVANTVDAYASMFTVATFCGLYFGLVKLAQVAFDKYLEVRVRMFCVNRISMDRFHNKEYTNREIATLIGSTEYLRLKSKRVGQGPESWNWQLYERKYGRAPQPEDDSEL